MSPESKFGDFQRKRADKRPTPKRAYFFFYTHEKSFHIPVGNSFSVDIVLQPDPSTQVQQDPQA